MNISGRTWRALAALAAAWVLATGIGTASPANADHIDSTDTQIVAPDWCFGIDEFDRPVGLWGTFTLDQGERYLDGCYRLDARGNILTVGGPEWIYSGSSHARKGYEHGANVANGRADWDNNRAHFWGVYPVDGVPTKFNGVYTVDSYGYVWFNGAWHDLGTVSDWYNAGYRAGYWAEKRRWNSCWDRITLVNVEPRTYGPELTFEVAQYLPEVPAERVVVGFEEISEGNRQPAILAGSFPWCVEDSFRYTASGPRLEINFGDTWYVFSYDRLGPYYQRYWGDIPGWEPKPVHNEDLWQRIPAMG